MDRRAWQLQPTVEQSDSTEGTAWVHTHTHTHSHTHSPSHLILMEKNTMEYHAGHRGWQAYKERLPVLMETKTRYATHEKYTITNGNQRMEGTQPDIVTENSREHFL